MSSGTTASEHGFVTVRGRGYRPEQVDTYALGLSQDRDGAWERAARLTVLAKEMEAESERLRDVVSRLAPQTYETLSERARNLLALGEEEAAAVRAAADADVQRMTEAAGAEAREVREAAGAYADEVLGEADERARQRLLACRATADESRIGARRDVKAWRSEALAALREVRERSTALLEEQEKEHAERREAAEREIAQREAEAQAAEDSLMAAAEARLSEAKRVSVEAEESARHGQEDAEARGAELLAAARVRDEQVARETERMLREHGEEWDEVRAHMEHVRSSLATLTGRAAAEGP